MNVSPYVALTCTACMWEIPGILRYLMYLDGDDVVGETPDAIPGTPCAFRVRSCYTLGGSK